MRTTKPWSLCVGAAAALAVVVTIGCDKVQSEQRQADRRVEAAVDAGKAKTVGLLDLGRDELAKAVAENDASPTMRAAGKAMHAQAGVDAAVRLMFDLDLPGDKRPAYGRAESAIARLNQLAYQLTVLTGDAGQMAQADPAVPSGSGSAPIKAIDDARAAAEKLVAELKDKCDATQKQIALLEQQVQTLTSERDANLTKAGDLRTKSDAAKGKEALDLFKQGAEANETASIKVSEMEGLELKLARLKLDLMSLENQRTLAETSLGDKPEALTARGKAINDEWAQIKQSGEARQAVAAKLVAGGEGTTDSLAAIAGDLSESLAAINATHEKVSELLTKSAEEFDAAFKDARQAIPMTAAPADAAAPSAALGRQLQAAHGELTYRLYKARTLNWQGYLDARQALLLMRLQAAMANVQAALEGGKLTMPDALKKLDPAASIGQLKEAAQAAYTAANGEFSELLDSSISDTGKADAAVGQIAMNYGMFALTQEESYRQAARSAYKNAMGMSKGATSFFGEDVEGAPRGKPSPRPDPVVTPETPAPTPETPTPTPETPVPAPETPAPETPAPTPAPDAPAPAPETPAPTPAPDAPAPAPETPAPTPAPDAPAPAPTPAPDAPAPAPAPTPDAPAPAPPTPAPATETPAPDTPAPAPDGDQ